MKRFHMLVVALLAVATLTAQEQPKVYMVANAHMDTHSHGSSRRNLIYECSYMYLLEVPVVEGSFKLPDDKDIVVFAATACNLGK